MKKKLLLIAFVASYVFTACDSAPKQVETEAEETVEETTETTTEATDSTQSDSVHFGKFIDAEDAKSIDEFATLMEGQDTVRIKIAATAKDVCQKKGCWMKVETADGSLMRVRFKDYGFFVPKDISGKEVVFEGIAFRDTVSVEDLKHYAEDAGKSPEEIAEITEPEVNTSFLADGVLISN